METMVIFLLIVLVFNRSLTIFALEVMKYDEFHRLVRANGWIKLRQMGTSHVIYKKGSRIYPVPYHRGKEIGTGLEKKIRKEMGLQ